ncbi:MAG: hypothetical protein QM656_02130 [Paracoccaceae bacterium]
MPLPRFFLVLPLLLGLAACADPPAVARKAAAAGPAPSLLPIDSILAQAQGGTITDQTGQALDARGQALRVRAAAIAAD